VKFASRLVQFESAPGDRFHPIATPIYQTATFAQDEIDRPGEYGYSRSGNPTRAVLERLLASLENGTRAFCFSSGMAAITAATRLLNSGEEILADIDLYGGTCRLFGVLPQRTGIGVRYADACDPEGFAQQIGPRTKMVYVESPTNPLFRIVDLRRMAAIAHEHGAVLCVDNSTMSPYLQNPLDLGADIVLHSATKYLSGHHDVTGGAIIVKDAALGSKVHFVQNSEGTALGPFDSYLVLRGMKTLKLRIDCQQRNAEAVARFLCAHEKVQRVYYPGLKDSCGYELQCSQARGAGSVLSFTTGSVALSKAIAAAAKMFHITVSFGSISSSISLPSKMSHASVPAEQLKLRNLPPDLLRVSIGIEDEEDLIADLDQAIRAASQSVGSVAG
jgi:cysteine-S-conjugate beta-lyase